MDQNALIEWKTAAWKDPAMVAWYAGRMVENQGTNRLKNRLEADLLQAYVIGDQIIDVGVGTGRGSLPFAAAGKQVLGIDSSQAMLDETRRLAGEIPMALELGDVQKLPVGDGKFDTLISLNCLMHFPHWRSVLTEWVRVMRPGGRLIFDIHSLDHYRLAHGAAAGEDEMQKVGVQSYYLLVAARDLLAEADRQGLTVVDIVPYGAFLGGGNANHLLATALESKHWWRRLLSWLASDPSLFEFAVFLEQELVARLTTVATGRYMAVLERTHDPARNRQWLDDKAQVNGVLSGTITLDVLKPLLRLSAEEFKSRLSGYVRAGLRNRRFLEGLVQGSIASGARIDLETFLEPDCIEKMNDWQQRRERDRDVTALAQGVLAIPEVAAALAGEGMPLADTLEYYLVEDLLSRYFGLFSGVRT